MSKSQLFIPNISIVVRVFNQIDFIEPWLYSLSQLEMSKELLVIDDHSTDGSKQLLQELQPKLRLKLILAAKTRGLGLCAKMALAHGKGKYATIIDFRKDSDIGYITNLAEILKTQNAIDLLINQADFIAKLGKLKQAGIEANDYLSELKQYAKDSDWAIKEISKKERF